MKGTAFCPSHITGFFKAHSGGGRAAEAGSTGAGFSIKHGVTTRVTASEGGPGHSIKFTGYEPDKTDVSEFVIAEFQGIAGRDVFLEVGHEISVPVGFGLGSSGAVALSLALALDAALGTGLPRTKIGQIAHGAEVSCKTGLGDVLASYHGGFEVRVRPGAPGVGSVEKIPAGDIAIVVACFSPISTKKFIKERLPQINGLGGRMVDSLLESKDYNYFQDMSVEFAKYVDVMTPRMQGVADELAGNGIRCGVALFGETVFSMVPKDREQEAVDILGRYKGGTVIRSGLDVDGARLLQN